MRILTTFEKKDLFNKAIEIAMKEAIEKKDKETLKKIVKLLKKSNMVH